MRSIRVVRCQAVAKLGLLTVLTSCCTAGFLWNCSAATTLYVSPTNANLQYRGRVDFSNPAAPTLYWAGNEVAAAFRGTAVSANLATNEYSTILATDGTNNYISVLVDDVLLPTNVHVIGASTNYNLASGLADGPHTVRFSRNIDFQEGPISFNGLTITGASPAVLPLPPKPQRRIEFYGDSITTGYGNLDANDQGSYLNCDNYFAYGAVTARAFDADYTCISKGGLGIVDSGTMPLVMSNLYSRLNPYDSNSVWNFNVWTPDVVVVNLGENDHSNISRPDTNTMISAYKNLFSALRSIYPKAFIIGTVGPMSAAGDGSPYPDFIARAVAALNDPMIVAQPKFAFVGGTAHPTVAQDRQMAEALCSLIARRTGWQYSRLGSGLH